MSGFMVTDRTLRRKLQKKRKRRNHARCSKCGPLACASVRLYPRDAGAADRVRKTCHAPGCGFVEDLFWPGTHPLAPDHSKRKARKAAPPVDLDGLTARYPGSPLIPLPILAGDLADVASPRPIG